MKKLALTFLVAVCLVPVGAHAATTSKFATSTGALVGWWTFDEGTSTTAGDFSINRYTATFSGTPTWTTGKRGKALQFNGSSFATLSSATQESFSGTQPFTVSAWVKTTPDSRRAIVSSAGFVNGGYSLAMDGGTANGASAVFFIENSPSTNAIATSPASYFATSTWNHVVGTYDGSVGRVYVNGVLGGTTSGGITIGANPNSMRIGGATQGGWNNFVGTIDDVRVYNLALSAAEVAALYRAGETVRKTANNSGLAGYWSFDEGTSTIAGDMSGNGGNGSLSNFSFPPSATSGWARGKKGGALSFDGSDDNVMIATTSAPSLQISDNFTVLMWVYLKSSGGGSFMDVINKSIHTSGGGLYMAYKNDVGFICGADNQSNSPVSGLSANDVGSWHLIACTTSSNARSIYVDGVFKASNNGGSSSWNNNGNLFIGAGTSGSLGTAAAFNANAVIDDVRVYNRVLSPQEIQSFYTMNQTKMNAPQETKITNGLAGMWTFNGKDISGISVFDVSGNGHHGTSTGSPTPTIGKVGQAMQFSGSNSQYVQAGGLSSLGVSNQPYTISTWIKPATANQSSDIIHVSAGSDGGGWCLSMLMMNGGKVQPLSWIGSPSTFTGSIAIPTDAWTHVVHVWSAANGLQLYVNGVLDGTLAQGTFSASGLSDYITFAAYLTGTGCSNDKSAAFNGAIDDTRVYSRALTAAEIKQLYLMGK